MNYKEFLETKQIAHQTEGIGIDQQEINSILFPFQKDIVQWALKKGKAAVFADTGLGKTFMQLEWAKQIPGDVLILAPLAVTKQTQKEAAKLGIDVTICRKQVDVKQGINITNYEMMEHFEANKFTGVVLDESSCLKNYSGVTKKEIVRKFKNTPFKLACTATPSPNDHMEILNHAEFLDVMKSSEALAIWFINDTMKMGSYRLKKFAVRDFWQWVSSWAVSIAKPSDFGYPDGDFKLPALHIIEHVVDVDNSIDTDGLLFRIPELSATSYHKEKRISNHPRAEKAAQVASESNGSVMIWCETNYEADEVKKLVSGAVEVRGSEHVEKKESAAMEFIEGKIRVLISKPSIFGFGLNFQHCHNVIFHGMSFSFESFYQAVRRFWRFGQKHEVFVHVIIGQNEREILDTVRDKETRFKEMKTNMNTIMNEFSELKGRAYRMDYDQDKSEGDNYKLILGDSIEEIKKVESDSIGLSIFSPPFSNLYIYSDSYRDMGNTKNDNEFFNHFEFMIPDILRITMPGRLCVVHCKDLVNYKGRDGASGLRDFPGRIITAFEKHGWQYHSRVTIWKDPVIEMQRTKSHGLLYKQLRKDSSYSRQGLPDYLVVFRKWDERGDISPVNWKTKENFELNKWQKYASPVWFDIQQTKCLNIQLARGENDEKHICPLQLDVIERCVELWSNPGDVIFSPFAGVGSEGYVAIQQGRKFLGIELKPEYYEQGKKYLKEAECFMNRQLSIY